MYKKLLAVGALVLVLALGAVGVAGAQSPDQGLFNTPFASNQTVGTEAFHVNTIDASGQAGVPDGTPVMRVFDNPYATSDLQAVLSVTDKAVYAGSYLFESNRIYDFVGNQVIRSRPGGTPSTSPDDVVFTIDGDTIYAGAYERFDAIAFRFDANTLYRGAYERFDAVVFTSNAPLSGQLVKILGLLADNSF